MSLALFDWECSRCGKVEERLEDRDVEVVKCNDCAGAATKIITFRGSALADDAAWLRSVTEVADKESPDPVTREFIKYPTRANYHRWMKRNGIRHLEAGETVRKEEIDIRRHTDSIMKMRYDRRRIEVGSRG